MARVMHAAAATAAAAAAAAARRNKILQCRHHHLVPQLPPRHGLATALGPALTSTSTKRARVREQLRHWQRGATAGRRCAPRVPRGAHSAVTLHTVTRARTRLRSCGVTLQSRAVPWRRAYAVLSSSRPRAAPRETSEVCHRQCTAAG